MGGEDILNKFTIGTMILRVNDINEFNLTQSIIRMHPVWPIL